MAPALDPHGHLQFGFHALGPDLHPPLRPLLGQRVAVGQAECGGDRRLPLGPAALPPAEVPWPGPGRRQAAQREGGGPEPLDLPPMIALEGPAGRTTRSRSLARGWPEPPAPHSAVEAKNNHTAATAPAVTSHQGQPSSSWAATPSAAPATVATR
jgi:hypothetical protein